jgi:hypothetical protein
MLESFKNLSEGWQTRIFGAGVAVGLAVVGGLIKLIKWLFCKKKDPAPQQKTIHQEGSNNTAATMDGDKNIVAVGQELISMVEITNGSITFQSNTSNFQPFIGFKMPIIGGYIKPNDFGKLEVYIQTEVPFQSLQRLNERLGLDSMRLLSESNTISMDADKPIVFTSSTDHILPQGEMILDISTWQEKPLAMNMHVQTQTTASGHLKGKVFQGKFEAILTYHEINFKIGLNGDFQAHLA